VSEGWDVEGWTGFVYGAAKADPEQPPSALALAEGLLGDAAVRFVPGRELANDALLALARCPRFDLSLPGAGRWEILVRRKLPTVRITWAVLHELAEWVLKEQEGYRGEDIERYANALAASLLAPRRAFLAAVAEVGPDFRSLAERFDATQSWAALRYAEVTGAALSLVTPTKVHRRGEVLWPDDAQLRLLASRGRPRQPPRLRLKKARLTDARGRTVLLVGLGPRAAALL
jgi:hypothetical protein